MTIIVQGGGALWYGSITNCVVTVQDGGLIQGESINGGGIMVNGSGKIISSSIGGNANVIVTGGGTVSNSTVQDGAYLKCGNGTVLNGTITNSGYISGGTLTGQGALENVFAGAAHDRTVASGATIAISGGGQIVGTVSVQAGGSAVLNGTVGGTINLAGAGYAEMTVSAGALPTTMITGFNGASEMLSDRITIAGLSKSQITWTGRGHCTVDTELEDDRAGYPVCIRKGALDGVVPERDLYVTAEHCLLVGGHFIPARQLVNGHSIAFDRTRRAFDYFHFETEAHSVVLAEGASSESYLDTGNRALYDCQSSAPILTPRHLSWDTDAAAPLARDRETIETVWRAIAARAGLTEVGERNPTHEADLHLECDDGTILRPVRVAGKKHVFILPFSARSVLIRSRASRPCDVTGPFVDDRRRLGVEIGQILHFASGKIEEIRDHLTHQEFKGWHARARDTARWTAGSAYLSLPADEGSEHRLLSLEILSAGPYSLEETPRAPLTRAG
ncbi:Hint domain-containing protein [Asaia sp. VD9]|uniref:Hint domain-containing protein n=1 Tax=Asaia sp. VD9 TaxID=3081235 RepID=UPI00301A777C